MLKATFLNCLDWLTTQVACSDPHADLFNGQLWVFAIVLHAYRLVGIPRLKQNDIAESPEMVRNLIIQLSDCLNDASIR